MAKKSSKKAKTNKTLRYAEYYGNQSTRDDLYARSQKGESFDNLMELILDENNIKEAYRNIKHNAGSRTPGTDGKTIKDIQNLDIDEVVNNVKKFVLGPRGYNPKAVRRKMIPKPDGDKRPLGIPCIWDRLIQQSIKQVLEPICEAKFSKHSYGFRPGKSVENAIAEVYRLINMSHLHFVVEIDIKGFFDNVDHPKLIRQLWALGIHDKTLLYLIKNILKTPFLEENGEKVYPNTGIPQGGIISPLLANVVLNELDHWIESQWEENPVTNKYSQRINTNGSVDKSPGYLAMRNRSHLKEMWITRYADDIRIFCRTKRDAEKVLYAVKDWLHERLKLEISEEKTKIINVKKREMSFLGFKIGVRKKSNKWVTASHVSPQNKARITKSLKNQIRKIASAGNSKEARNFVRGYNSIVLGEQNYFRIATDVNLDFMEIEYQVKKVLATQLRPESKKGGRLSKTGQLSKFEEKRFGKSKMLRWDKACGSPIYPIGYIQNKNPIEARHGLTPYTQDGRDMMHTKLGINTKLMIQLMRTPTYRSIEYSDNRISLFAAQWGKCGVIGREFERVENIHCHHIIPVEFGGSDNYENLILITKDVHRLIHATSEETIMAYLKVLQLNSEALKRVNNLRDKAGNKAING